LAVGASETLTGSHIVTQAEIDAGTALTNTASVVSTQTPTPKSASATTAIDQDPGIDIEKLVSIDGGLNWYFLPDNGDTVATIYADIHSAGSSITESQLHAGTPVSLSGVTAEFEVVVTNTGNVTEHVTSLIDSQLYTFGALSGILGTVLAPGQGEASGIASNIASSVGLHDNTVTVGGTDPSDTHVTASDSDTAEYQIVAQATGIYTKGYWANHSWSGIEPSSSHGNLILGDVNGNGAPDDTFHNPIAGVTQTNDDLSIANSVAQALANSSTSSDARIIVASQLVAAQMNDYNDHGVNGGVEPNGLIQEAVQWLTGNNFGIAPANTDALANVDLNHDGVLDNLTPSTAEYSIAKNGSITFAGPALSSSSPAFQTMQTVLSASDSNNWDHVAISANGNGLANALTAFNQGQLVLSADGSLIGWNNGTSVVDVHNNTANAFWGILHDQHIAGVS
jgi:hypothetical protein